MDKIVDLEDYKQQKLTEDTSPIHNTHYVCDCGTISFYIFEQGYVCCGCNKKHTFDSVHGDP